VEQKKIWEGGLGSLEEIKAIQAEINDILEREDVRWKQRAKQHRYLSGDRNT